MKEIKPEDIKEMSESELHKTLYEYFKPVLEDFEKEPKTLIISMDTLGQDRTFSESEKNFAQDKQINQK